MDQTLLEYFKYDELASFVWNSKYKMGDEKTPQDMFERHIVEIAQKEYDRITTIPAIKLQLLSEHGKGRFQRLLETTNPSVINGLDVKNNIVNNLRKWLNFDNIILGGSMLQGIGNHALYSSLSNCFVVGQPFDSYPGINKKEDEIAQLMKRRGGAGIDLSTIRPFKAAIHNQATFSSGPVLFAEGYSNKTKQVAQLGRRGALMISLHLKHPDSKEFIMAKMDESKITGANISVKIPDDFMEAVVNDTDYVLCFPVETDLSHNLVADIIANEKYDELFDLQLGGRTVYIKKIHARELWQTIIDCAHSRAEPGILFIGNWEKYGPDYVYEQYRPISTNPCSEIPMQAYDACRLLSGNFYKLVRNAFTKNADIPAEEVYNLFYEQQIIADLLVDLEVDYIDRICAKIASGNDPQELKDAEIGLWTKVKNTALAGRRCGSGFTALGDCLAALGLQYSNVAIVDSLFQIKLSAELDATIDMAILYGAFDGYNAKLEEKSDFIQMIRKNFSEQYYRMIEYGRRNVSWSTGAPTGTLSIMTQTTSGVEPLFKFSYKRRKKCITPDERIDYTDPADGQNFTEYFVVHPQFIEWFHTTHDNNYTFLESKTYLENCTEARLAEIFKESPWFGNEANDIDWKHRIQIQAAVQKYTSHAISSTINLPNDIDKSIVGEIYMASWKAGLKGNTVYREGCRAGVLVSNSEENGTVQKTEPKKRPRVIPGHYYTLMYRNKKYSIIIGLKNNKPYEIFIVSGLANLPQILDDNACIEGEIVKDSTDWYNFEYDTFILREISDMENEEKMLSLMLSGLMRFDAPLAYITKILEKTKPIAGSFTHRLIKILSNYYTDEEVANEPCPNCGASLTHENGCVSCKVCGWSKC